MPPRKAKEKDPEFIKPETPGIAGPSIKSKPVQRGLAQQDVVQEFLGLREGASAISNPTGRDVGIPDVPSLNTIAGTLEEKMTVRELSKLVQQVNVQIGSLGDKLVDMRKEDRTPEVVDRILALELQIQDLNSDLINLNSILAVTAEFEQRQAKIATISIEEIKDPAVDVIGDAAARDFPLNISTSTREQRIQQTRDIVENVKRFSKEKREERALRDIVTPVSANTGRPTGFGEPSLDITVLNPENPISAGLRIVGEMRKILDRPIRIPGQLHTGIGSTDIPDYSNTQRNDRGIGAIDEVKIDEAVVSLEAEESKHTQPIDVSTSHDINSDGVVTSSEVGIMASTSGIVEDRLRVASRLLDRPRMIESEFAKFSGLFQRRIVERRPVALATLDPTKFSDQVSLIEQSNAAYLEDVNRFNTAF